MDMIRAKHVVLTQYERTTPPEPNPALERGTLVHCMWLSIWNETKRKWYVFIFTSLNVNYTQFLCGPTELCPPLAATEQQCSIAQNQLNSSQPRHTHTASLVRFINGPKIKLVHLVITGRSSSSVGGMCHCRRFNSEDGGCSLIEQSSQESPVAKGVGDLAYRGKGARFRGKKAGCRSLKTPFQDLAFSTNWRFQQLGVLKNLAFSTTMRF